MNAMIVGEENAMDTQRVRRTVESPVGPLWLVAEGGALTGVHFDEQVPEWVRTAPADEREESVLARAAAQLDEYFAGTRQTFDLPLAFPRGTDFQREVWAGLQAIGFGERASYEVLATRVGRPTAVRAVGAANGRNPLAIVVPCHRVIGKDGSLTGYAGGLARKRYLLALEARSEGLTLRACSA